MRALSLDRQNDSIVRAFMRKAFKFLIVVWMTGTLFAFLVLRGDGLVYIGDLLNLQVRMIHLPGRALSVVDRIHSEE